MCIHQDTEFSAFADVALVATRERWKLLIGDCLPSIREQSRPPCAAVVVNDGPPLSPAQLREVAAVLSPTRCVVLPNRRIPGAAGAWNTGLAYLQQRGHRGFVALLDDDDAWDVHHLEANHAAASSQAADIVVSGLRRLVDGVEVPRPLPAELAPCDFLTGNPGWQGSNTYVSMRCVTQVRGFRDGLASLNDRDLAVRLLRLRGVRVAYTGEWTSNWHVRTGCPALSTPRSAAKLSGLRWFWRIYGAEMNTASADAFFERAWRCFGVTHHEMVTPAGDVPPHIHRYGDLEP